MNFESESWTFEAPTRPESMADQVHRQLSMALQSGAYAPLERINLRRLAAEIGISVTPVREAVMRLVSEDILALTDKSAIVVPQRTTAEIAEIFALRRMLEGDLAALAAAHLQSADVARLKETHATLVSAAEDDDFKEVLRCNALFHFHIYGLAQRPLQMKIICGLWLMIGPTLRYMYPYLQRGRRGDGRHEGIIDAARTGDPDKLRAAVVADLEAAEDAVRQYLKSAAAPGVLRRRVP